MHFVVFSSMTICSASVRAHFTKVVSTRGRFTYTLHTIEAIVQRKKSYDSNEGHVHTSHTKQEVPRY